MFNFLQLQFTVSRKRSYFNRPVIYSDGLGLESVEITSVPDPEGEIPLIRLELEMGVQAVEETKEVACQTERYIPITLYNTHTFNVYSSTCRRQPCNAVVQYEPRILSEAENQAIMEGEDIASFLQTVCPMLVNPLKEQH